MSDAAGSGASPGTCTDIRTRSQNAVLPITIGRPETGNKSFSSELKEAS